MAHISDEEVRAAAGTRGAITVIHAHAVLCMVFLGWDWGLTL